LASFANESADYETAARMAGEARRLGRGKPSLADALLGALALRTGATVATLNLKDFVAMGIAAENPLAIVEAI
jgi:predicted nucleic acid-binding protein